MKGLDTIEVVIEGTTPLLCNRFTDQAQLEASTGSRSSMSGDRGTAADNGPADWKVDTRPVRIPATGGRILAHRPCFDEWALMFTLSVDSKNISVRQLREIVDAAGYQIGLGDFRPDCKGPFGKFVVNQWKVQDTKGRQQEVTTA